MPTSNTTRRAYPDRLVINAMGLRGGGKTDFYTTMPKPLLVLSVDPNTPAVMKKVFGEELDPEEVRLVQAPFPVRGFEDNETQIKDEANHALDILHHEISDVYHGRCEIAPASVAIDTGSELHELFILSEFGRTDKIPPAVRRIKMGGVNQDFKGVFRALEKAGVQVCVAHRVRQHFDDATDKPVPGVYDWIGHKEMGNICNAEVLLMFDHEREGKLSAKFGMRITRSTARPALTGQEYWGRVKSGEGLVRAASFPYLATLMCPDTKVEDWE